MALGNAINAKDYLTAQMMARNSASFATEIREGAVISAEADRALDLVLSKIQAVPVALRQFGGAQGESAVEAVRKGARDDHERLCRLLDDAKPSEMARILGLA